MSLSGQLRILREAIHVWLETGMATYSSSLTWRILRTEESGGLQSTGSQRVAHGWVTNKHTHTHTHIRYEQGKLRSLNFAVNLKLLYKIKSIKNVWFTSYHFLKVTLGHSIKRPKFWSWFFSTLAVEPGQAPLKSLGLSFPIFEKGVVDEVLSCSGRLEVTPPPPHFPFFGWWAFRLAGRW